MQSETENSGAASAGRDGNPESGFSRKRTFRLSFMSRKVTPGGRKQQQQLSSTEDEHRPLEDRKSTPATTSTSTKPEQPSTYPVVREPVVHSDDQSTRGKSCGRCENSLGNPSETCIVRNCENPGEHPRLVPSTSSSSVKSYDREVNIKQWVEVEKKGQSEGAAIYKSVVKEITIKTKETVRVDSSQVDSGRNEYREYFDSGQTNNTHCEPSSSGYSNKGDNNYRVLTKFEKVLGERIVLHDNRSVGSSCSDKNCNINDKKTIDAVGLENPGYNFVPDSSSVIKTEHVSDFEVPRVTKPTSDYFEVREPYKGLENAGFVEYSTNPFLEPGIVDGVIQEEGEGEVGNGQGKSHIEKYPCGIENAAFETVNSTNPFLPCYLPQEIEGPNSEICEYESGDDQEESIESYDGDICPELYGTDNLGFDNRCQIASSVESLPSLLAVDEAYLQRIRDGSPVDITSNIEDNANLPPSILIPRGCTQKRKRKSVHFSKTVDISDGETVRTKKMKKLADLNGRFKNDIKKRRTIVGSGTENFGFCENPPRPANSRIPSALPVVSLYSTPPRRHAKRSKTSNLEDNNELFKNQRLVGVPEAVKENFPVFPEVRPNRLSKIVKRLGPEVLTATATGSSTTDSVLAQVMKHQYQDAADDRNAKRTGDNCGANFGSTGDLANCDDLSEQSRRRRKRKSPHDIFALFAAVEHGHVEKARTILESTDVDVNSVNSDGLSPLDVAVLSNNRQLAKMLVAFGAREGNQFGSGDKLLAHLHQLAREAEHHVQELGGSGGESDNRAYTQTGSDKTLALWERRSRGLNKMILGFDQARPPDIPFLVVADVTGKDSVTVRYQEPEHHDSPICTKYRVEWSCCPDFSALAGFKEVLEPKQLECHVDGLERGRRYYFRVACGNIRGFGNFRMSYPQSIIPSSWRDVVQKEERLPSSGLALFDRLFQEVRSARPDLKGVGSPAAPGETPLGQRRKKTTIKQLFTAASKFQKHLRRGVYFSCLLYNEDRVLVTNEDFLPVIEVDETYPGSIYHDFHWLLKVACTWEDVKWLKQDMEKSLSSSAVHFRIKLLQAAAQMQTALSIQDLGQLYHKPLRDSEGTIVVCTVNYVKSPKSVSVLNSRWLPLGKLTKRAVQPTSETSIGDILMASIQEQITYHQVSSIRLPRGLYLGYLKMRSSVDLLQVLVPTKSPNVPPHCKIRDNSHVTAEEWEWLRIGCGGASGSGGDCSEQQRDFVEQVAATARRLFTYMEVPAEEAPSHRLYDGEVVELSSDVSFLMVVPPPESACAAPGQRELLLQRPDLLPLPVQVFEMVHLGTYQRQLVSRYSRLSCILELDTALAQHSHREAFSSSEVSVARERLARLEGLQAQLNAAWKSARWLLDVLAFARDRLTHSPTTIRHLLHKRSRDHLEASNNGLLQPPDPKAVKSRGSWPGPGVARLLGSCPAEMSRSDQHLSGTPPPPPPHPPHPHSPTPPTHSPPPPPLPPPRPTPTRPPPPANDHIETIRLPPSRSEDTLHMHTRITPRTRATVSATTSPLLPSRPTGYGSGNSLQSSSEESALANQTSKSEGEAEEEGATVPAPAPGILQVYAAYETGLAAGTSLKLHVSPRTSAREVVDLVVKQLNMAVVLKGKDGPIYAADQLSNFCLVAVIGARERCLRDDFKPLQLQNPWKKGRLYVRQKHDVLAALEHSSRHSAFL